MKHWISLFFVVVFVIVIDNKSQKRLFDYDYSHQIYCVEWLDIEYHVQLVGQLDPLNLKFASFVLDMYSKIQINKKAWSILILVFLIHSMIDLLYDEEFDGTWVLRVLFDITKYNLKWKRIVQNKSQMLLLYRLSVS